MAVEKTLDGVAGGNVSALALIDRFAGTLYRQSRRVKVCTVPVREIVKRSAETIGSLVRGGVWCLRPHRLPSTSCCTNENVTDMSCVSQIFAACLTPVSAPRGTGGSRKKRAQEPGGR